MASDMSEILGLVRSGRLNEATTAIQKGLTGASETAEAAGRPMKDVTPSARALPPMPGANPKPQRRMRPRSKPTSGMERRSGALPYRLFTPSVPRPGAPLIVMLHGCTQSPEDFAAGTRMNAAAERIGAHVIWPEQGRAANPNLCWNWFEPAHQRAGGEAGAIAAVIREVAAALPVQPGGVHVAGLSAGGAMAAILGAQHPDLVASVAIHSGLPAGSARDVPSAFAAMRSGGSQAQSLRDPAIIFQGLSDRTVAPVNARNLVASAIEGDKPRRRTTTLNGRKTTVIRREVAAAPVMELWEIEALGHAWSGGDAAGSYADPLGPDATAEMVRFFGEVDKARN